MNVSLPTQPNQPQCWEEGAIPPPTLTAPVDQAGNCSVKTAPSRATDPANWRSYRNQLAILAALVFLCMASYGIVTRYVMTAVIIEGRSMTPTLEAGDRFILDRWSYHYRDPERGDLVVLKDPGHKDYAVKRIVGLPGETILLKDGVVFLNGQRLIETYLRSGTQTFCSDMKNRLVIVGKDQYFVMGDNRANSEDSRFYGAVPRERIIGTIFK